MITQNQGNIFDFLKEKYYLCIRFNQTIQVYDKKRDYRRSSKLHKYCCKMGKADKLRFMNISQGSLEECRCYVILSRDLGYIDNEVYNILYSKIEEASKLLNGYCKAMLNSTFSNTLE